MKKLFTPDANQMILRIAAFYAMILGIVITFAPKALLNVFGMQIPDELIFWQFAGIVSGVSGIGLYIASYDPSKNWPIVFVGFLVSLFGSLIFIKGLVSGIIPTNFGLFLLLSLIIWSVPFYYILQSAYAETIAENSVPKQFSDLLRFVKTNQNESLLDLSNKQNVLLIFIRHFGCTFCRETVSEMAKIDKAVAERDLKLVFVHMSDPAFGDEFFSKYYDHPVHHISDPGRMLYKSLNLKRGTFYQIFGLNVWLRGLYAGIIKGHGIGSFEGDILQLGGVFLLSKGQIVFEQKAKNASEVFQFNALPEV